MTNIIEALDESGMSVVFPVHPGTQKCLQEYGLLERMPGNVGFIKPLGYLDMLMANARKILTDFGGIQKEAYMLGVPCVMLRENTEWVETLEGGWNKLVGADKGKIVEAIQCFYPSVTQKDIFGSAEASGKILSAVANIQT